MELLCIDFMNSQWYNHHDLHREPLTDPLWVAEFLNRWDITPVNGFPDQHLPELIRLRQRLLRAVDELEADRRLSTDSLEAVNRCLSHSALHYQLTGVAGGFAATLKPARQDWQNVLTQICISFSQFLIEFAAERIKRCKNAECQWVFYDESKNNSRKWCCNTCASLIKVRQYRQKRQTTP